MRDQRDIWKKLSEGERHLSVLFVVCSLYSALLFTVKPVQAYMQEETCSVNHFSFAHIRTLSAELTEPAWRTESGQYFLPGQETAKDPQIKNTSTDGTDELVALRVTFVYQDTCPDEEKRGKPLTDDDMHMLSGILDIDFEADQSGIVHWNRFAGERADGNTQHFYYGPVLRGSPGGDGESTIPLFTKVRFLGEAGNAEYDYLRELGGFRILIDGCVCECIPGDTLYGLDSPTSAYEAGRFVFP